MNSINSKLLFLPLRELQHYLTNLEIENEKLKSELSTFSRLNCILLNIKRSSNKGFNAMQCLDRNKSCRCNEHLNGRLRRVAQEADIELRVWQEQYDKVVNKSKTDYNSSVDDENSMSFSSKSSNTVSPFEELHMESENETNCFISINDNKYYNNRYDVNNFSNNRFGSNGISNVSQMDTNKSPQKLNCDQKDKNSVSDEAVIKYITLSPDTESRSNASPPVVVFDSKKESKLVCDWPECSQVFVNEEILMNHKRNHIRKSIYHCEYCNARLLSKEDFETHLKSHRICKSEDDLEVGVEDKNTSNDGLIVEKTQTVNSLNNKAVNDKTNESLLSFQSSFEKFNQKSNDKSSQSDNSKNDLIKPEEYKRTRYSGVGRYRCPWPDCGYTPHFLRDLRRHMYKHTGDKKHKCDFAGCDFVSVWKTSLLQHQRKKHSSDDSVNKKN